MNNLLQNRRRRSTGKMDRAKWEEWRVAPEGPRKRRLFGELVAGNESLAQWVADGFIERSAYYLHHLKDDILQAALLGVMTALQRWEPEKGAFSALAFRWARHEMQQVTRHVKPVSYPTGGRGADLPRAKQDAAAKFAAQHGREPEPEEIGVAPAAASRAQAARAKFIGCRKVLAADAATEDDIIDAIDGGEPRALLLEYLGSLSDDELEAAWELTAKQLIEKAKGLT